ncbi:hypothetical protein [Bacillus sp. R45]|uniref:hypothetical protein n=1 Tax=Bacillus sp. R45 TaxID=2912260 RepID=UPI001F487010|nr:hypothetical protein [Bacillus sp. R45]UJX16500.1 hypothetical protein L3V45_09335 [Bacillus sp. R45]
MKTDHLIKACSEWRGKIININFYFPASSAQTANNIIGIFLSPGLWGSLIGATISACVAIMIMQANAKREIKNKKIDRLEQFLIEAIYFRDNIMSLKGCLEKYVLITEEIKERLNAPIKRDDSEYGRGLSKAQISNEEYAIRCLNNLKNVDKNKFSFEYVQHYSAIVEVCSTLEHYFYFLKIHTPRELGVKQAINKLESELRKLNEIIETNEREFLKLNN